MKKSVDSSNEFRCLSIRQPWAWLACIGAKPIENRVWKTDFRGTIAIHASTSQTMVRNSERHSESRFIKLKDFQFGAIIGLVDLVAIDIYGKQHEDDGHACGPYCWKFENPRLLKNPIPMMGKLNLFKLNAELSESVRNAETYVLDWRNDTRLETIVKEFQPEPEASERYANTFAEVRDKADHGDLTLLLDRWTEIDHENIEAWQAWTDFYQDPLDEAKFATGVQRLSVIIEEIFGNQDDAWREVYMASVSNKVEIVNGENDADATDEEASNEDCIADLQDPEENEADEEDLEESDPIDDYWELISLLKSQFWNYMILEQNDSAIETAKRVVYLAAEDAEANLNLGYAYTVLSNDFELALLSLEKAWQLVQAVLECQNSDEEATSEVRKILELKPTILNELAGTYRSLGQLDRAHDTIQLVLNENPEVGEIQLQAALIARDRGDKKHALKYAKAALVIDPDSEQAAEIIDMFDK